MVEKEERETARREVLHNKNKSVNINLMKLPPYCRPLIQIIPIRTSLQLAVHLDLKDFTQMSEGDT